MKYVTNHPTYGEIQLDWGFWTGKFKLAIGGKELKKVSKTGFELQLPDSEAPVSVQVFGNNFKGFGVMIGTQPIQLSPPAKWYDIVLSVIPAVIWFIMIGGAIGGGLGALSALTSLFLMIRTRSLLIKILIGVGAFLITVLIAFLLALLLILILA